MTFAEVKRLAAVGDRVIAHHRAQDGAPRRGRLPPYGRRLLALRRAGRVPGSHRVSIAVHDWTLIDEARDDALVLPRGEDPASFDWRVVAGLAVLMRVNERDLDAADRLATAVMGAGSRGCAALIDPSSGRVVGWRLYQSHFEELRDVA